MAGDEAAVERAQGRALRAAEIRHIGAAGREHAAFWRIERRRQFALRHAALALAAKSRGRVEQGLRIGMQRPRKMRSFGPCSTAIPRYMIITPSAM